MSSKRKIQSIRGWLPKQILPPTYQQPNTGMSKTSLKQFVEYNWLVLVGFICGINLSISTFSINPVAFAVFAWGTCFSGMFLALGFLVATDKELNPEATAGLLLSTVSLGGISVNAYLFAVPTGFLTRLLFVSLLIAFHTPLAVGLLARAVGKKQLYRKIINYYPTKVGWFKDAQEKATA